jgi:predicted nucleic acid-binding protein
MTLAEIPRLSAAFIDANILIYHFAGRSDECSALLARMEAAEIRGLTSQPVLLEVAHRLMVIEAGAGADTRTLRCSCSSRATAFHIGNLPDAADADRLVSLRRRY